MRCTLTLLITVFVSFFAVAQETASSDDKDETAGKKPKISDEMVVTATRSEREVSELPVSTSVVSEEEIESAPAVSVDDVLRSIPGVYPQLQGSTTHGTANASRISMRGLGGTRALVLLDGIPMHDPLYGTVQWHRVPLDNVRQMEVVRGGSAGLFGNHSLGGTINLLTRPVDSSGVRVDLAAGNMDTQRHSLAVDHLVNERLGLRLSHNRFNSDGFIVITGFPPSPTNIPSWTELASTAARADYEVSDSARGFLKLNWTETGLSRGSPFSEHQRNILDVAGGMQRSAGRAGLLVTSLFYSTTTEDELTGGVLPGTETSYLANAASLPRRAMGGSVEWSKQLAGSIPFVTLGVDFQSFEMDEEGISYSSSGAITEQRFGHGRQRFAGVFGQASWQPSERLEILSTLRVDYYQNADGSESVVGGTTTDYPTVSTTQVDPRVSLHYSLRPGLALRGAAYRAFKAPALRELYRTTRTRTNTFLANPFLEPETLIGAEAGIEWATANARVAMNVYRSEVDGLQVRAAVAGLPANVARAINVGKIRSQGVELMADADLSRVWSVEAGYTYADSTIIEDLNAAVIGKRVPEVPAHMGTLSVRYRSARGTSVDLRGRVLSRAWGDPANLALTPAHRVLDLSLSHPVREWLEAYAAIENILDERYYYSTTPGASRNARPRGIMAGVRMQIPTAGSR